MFYMTISTIILTLGLKVVFVDIANPYCGIDTNYPYTIGGCYDSNTKTIFLSLNSTLTEENKISKRDINENLFHETGHDPFFSQDKEIRIMISSLPSPRYYPKNIYKTEESVLMEKISDYFAMYMKYPDFPDKFPKIKELFDLRLSKLNK